MTYKVLTAEDLGDISTNHTEGYEAMLQSALNIQEARGFTLVTLEETGETTRWIFHKAD